MHPLIVDYSGSRNEPVNFDPLFIKGGAEEKRCINNWQQSVGFQDFKAWAYFWDSEYQEYTQKLSFPSCLSLSGQSIQNIPTCARARKARGIRT
jgi:hypothetical protein